ncbi:MAG: metal-dependent transcriptional regulator [Nitrospirota bacterium]|jgi:DtxR family Mn-dependent transcriptional regulator
MTDDKPTRIMPDEATAQGLYEDEVLETVWLIRERQPSVDFEELLKEMGNEEGLRRMQKRGLIQIQEGKVILTEDGERRARDITRRHRLAERLFHDVLDVKDFEPEACRLEHAISPEVEEAICTLLGHPPVCPHGKPIPRGKCCTVYARKVKPLVSSLKDLQVGARARVMFINVPAMDRLASLGLVPGSVIVLHQRKPSFVIDIDETTIALDEEIARGIFVKQAEEQ